MLEVFPSEDINEDLWRVYKKLDEGMPNTPKNRLVKEILIAYIQLKCEYNKATDDILDQLTEQIENMDKDWSLDET